MGLIRKAKGVFLVMLAVYVLSFGSGVLWLVSGVFMALGAFFEARMLLGLMK